ncbi:NAD(P)-binding protein [Viridothelium virens]|uniref:NAD(P)-binding protein n=1 Tax=Viridothelium virens TaxID=1048519 RepID=A0A6A6HFD6_VIRVR|nr:NAD(P)-binding protein [Viridothelium virens]
MPDQQKYNNKLHDTRVLIIGGSSGLGFTAAEAILESGAGAVILSSSNPQRIGTALDRLKALYPSRASAVSGHECNLADEVNLENNIKALFDFATDNGSKKLDHILFTAGDRLAIKPMTETTFDAMKQAGLVRFFAPLLVGKYAIKHLKAGRQSSFIITSGGVSQRPHQDWTVVGSFASGHFGMVRGLALDLAPRRCMVVCPGFVNTELWDWMEADAKNKLLQGVASAVPTQAAAQPEDIAQAYLYVMKDPNCTGQVITTDSGNLLKGPG